MSRLALLKSWNRTAVYRSIVSRFTPESFPGETGHSKLNKKRNDECHPLYE